LGVMSELRTYRHWVRGKDLVSFNVSIIETDLYIRALTNLKRRATKLVLKYRHMLEGYIERYPLFLTSLQPVPTGEDAPQIVKAMSRAAETAGVGPMAAVAGAIAEFVGGELLAFSPEVIVENGGDIYLKSLRERVVGVYAGESPLTSRIGIVIKAEDTPLGICTSSGTVGHSLSYGKADAVVVIAKSAVLADAAATAIGNLIARADDIPEGIEFAKGVVGLRGVLIVKEGNLGLWGEVKLCSVRDQRLHKRA
jgi:ApbE superfamily uncharacterized protein (UPF0280 family)